MTEPTLPEVGDLPMPAELRGIAPTVGNVWIWMPHAKAPGVRQQVRVTQVIWNGEECWVESEGYDRRYGREAKGRHWNDLSRWMEAAVLVRASDERGSA